MARINLYLSQEEKELWELLAQYNKMTISVFVREMMREVCRYKEKEIKKRVKELRDM